MKQTSWFGLKVLAMVVLALVAAGCSCTPEMGARDVAVSLDNSLRDNTGKLKSVQVDIIAVNTGEIERWKQETLDVYWRPGGSNLALAQDKVVMKFDAMENVPAKTLSVKDPCWAGWKAKNAMDLVVVANIPGYRGGGAGMADSRRLVLPLDRCRWASASEPLQVRVSSAGVTSLTEPKPEKK
ncbi:MAG: hypothetical protein ACHRHE_02055 [Tepidisphaerales bacterium]